MEDNPKPTPEPSQAPSDPQSGLTRLWAELKRRHVVRVAITYAVVAWLIIQIASSTFGWFDIPVWAYRFVVFMVILGFPIAVIVAWAFELTPEGIKTSKTAREEHLDSHKDESHAKKRHWFSLGVAAAVPTLIFGVLALFFYLRSGTSDSEPAPIEQVELENDKSIAVLPLENLSPDPDNAFFADGVQEDILTNLSKIEELLVISRSSTLRYRERDKSLKEIGAELDVRYVVEGSVRRAANRVLVTVQLIEVETDAHLWAENFNRPLDDIFAIQAEIAKTIADELHTVISPEAVAKIEYRPTENQAAYDLYLMSRWKSGLYAMALMEKAVALDPEFAEAWAQLAGMRCMSWVRDKGRDDPKLLAQGHDALNEAKRWGPDLPHLRVALSRFELYEEGNYEASIDYLLEALAIDPSFQAAQVELARRYRTIWRLPEAQRYFEAALRTDPLSKTANLAMVSIYQLRGMWDEARDLIELNLERMPGDGQWRKALASLEFRQNGDRAAYVADLEAMPGFIETSSYKAWKALLSRDLREGLRFLEKFDPDEDSINSNMLTLRKEGGGLWMRPLNLLFALIWFELGEEEEWRTEAEKAKNYLEGIVKADPMADANFWSNLMVCYALLGDRDQVETASARAREQMINSAPWKYGNYHGHQQYKKTYEGIAYLILGDRDAAIEHLVEASKLDGGMPLNRELDLWFIFDRLRGNPRFDALLK